MIAQSFGFKDYIQWVRINLVDFTDLAHFLVVTDKVYYTGTSLYCAQKSCLGCDYNRVTINGGLVVLVAAIPCISFTRGQPIQLPSWRLPFMLLVTTCTPSITTNYNSIQTTSPKPIHSICKQ